MLSIESLINIAIAVLIGFICIELFYYFKDKSKKTKKQKK